MTEPKQPDALRLADALEGNAKTTWTRDDAAAELRRLHAENTTLQQGYDAARLEIGALQARIKAMAEERADELAVAHLDGRMRGRSAGSAGEYPPLPKPALPRGGFPDLFDADQMRAYADADRAMRAQAAPVAQELHPSPPGGMLGGWISTEERLPESDVPVLAHNGKWSGVAAWMSGDYLEPLERWQDEHRECVEMMGPAVTHWMPLPPPPTTSAGSGKG